MQLILIKVKLLPVKILSVGLGLVNMGIRCIESLFSSIYSHLKIPVKLGALRRPHVRICLKFLIIKILKILGKSWKYLNDSFWVEFVIGGVTWFQLSPTWANFFTIMNILQMLWCLRVCNQGAGFCSAITSTGGGLGSLRWSLKWIIKIAMFKLSLKLTGLGTWYGS